jgi:hypothetical protein
MHTILVRFVKEVNHSQCIARERLLESLPFHMILQERATTSFMHYSFCLFCCKDTNNRRQSNSELLMVMNYVRGPHLRHKESGLEEISVRSSSRLYVKQKRITCRRY